MKWCRILKYSPTIHTHLLFIASFHYQRRNQCLTLAIITCPAVTLMTKSIHYSEAYVARAGYSSFICDGKQLHVKYPSTLCWYGAVIADCRGLVCHSYPTSLLVLAELGLLLCLRFTLLLCCWLANCLAARCATSLGAEAWSLREAPAAWEGLGMCLSPP